MKHFKVLFVLLAFSALFTVFTEEHHRASLLMERTGRVLGVPLAFSSFLWACRRLRFWLLSFTVNYKNKPKSAISSVRHKGRAGSFIQNTSYAEATRWASHQWKHKWNPGPPESSLLVLLLQSMDSKDLHGSYS